MPKLNGPDPGSASGPLRPGRVGADLAERLQLIRAEFCGPGGVAAMARSLGVPAATWSNFEAGVAIPGRVLLAFLVVTSVEPRWLLSGSGPRYREVVGTGPSDASGA